MSAAKFGGFFTTCTPRRKKVLENVLVTIFAVIQEGNDVNICGRITSALLLGSVHYTVLFFTHTYAQSMVGSYPYLVNLNE